VGNGVFEIGIILNFLRGMVDMAYPPKTRCLSCGNPLKNYNEYYICNYCKTSLPFISGFICKKCGRPLEEETNSDGLCGECAMRVTYFDEAAAVFEFSGAIQDMLHRLKYEGETDIASSIGKFMAWKLKKENWHIDVIAPVPLHTDRMKERGFNQSYLLASTIGWECGIDVSEGLLKRKRYTESQVSLSRLERIFNVKDAFDASESEIEGKSVLVVDDIMTTGSTLNECSKAIRGYSPKNVYCLAAACPFHQK
jgi:ComF family protein